MTAKLARITCPAKTVREFVNETLTIKELETARRIVLLTQDDGGEWRISYHNVSDADLALVALYLQDHALNG